jgi:hypothetical protein
MTVSRTPPTIALGLSLLVIAEIGLFQFAGTHQIGWLVMKTRVRGRRLAFG